LIFSNRDQLYLGSGLGGPGIHDLLLRRNPLGNVFGGPNGQGALVF